MGSPIRVGARRPSARSRLGIVAQPRPSSTDSLRACTLIDTAQATIFSLRAEQLSGVAEEIGRKRTFGGRLTDRAHCQAVFARHNQAVQETIPPDRLLVCAVKEGWEPLCAFFDVPVPEDEPFPRVNEAATFQDEERRERRERAMRALAT